MTYQSKPPTYKMQVPGNDKQRWHHDLTVRMLKKIFLSLVVAQIMIAVPLAVFAGSLTPQSFVVDPGSYRHWVFEVSRSARLFGEFRAQGGGGNDISVLVVDVDEFEHFVSGHAFRSYFDSGRVTQGQIDLRIRSGRYVIIFDNRFSPFSKKDLSSSLQLAED
jgi:hypothetical protein